MTDQTKFGLEVLTESRSLEFLGLRFGLLMNQASVNSQFRYACDLIHVAWPGQLKRLFSPQHGFWGEQQANMIESPDSCYRPLNLPVHSLYAETRRPSTALLRDLDVLLIDLQDVGTRVYTFIWTMLECLRACAECNVRVVVLDRPNPLGGNVVEGPLIKAGYESFVGDAAIPMRHGLTMGELAQLLNAENSLGANVSVIPMQHWNRAMMWPDTGRAWVLPSPNMPCPSTAFVYPGQVLLEGTNLSEGRGTTRPFELCGAPWLDPDQLLKLLEPLQHPGVKLQPMRFRPTFDKFKGETCGGLAIHVTDASAVRSFRLTLDLLNAVKVLCPTEFRWLDPPYEYETVKPPIDILYGNDNLRRRLQTTEGLTVGDCELLATVDELAWKSRVQSFWIYPA